MAELAMAKQQVRAHEFEKIPQMGVNTNEAQAERLKFLEERFGALPYIRGEQKLGAEDLNGNCEAFIGWWQHPLQIGGPIFIKKGTGIEEEHIYIPLATHEGTLAASATRGAFVMNYSGGLETEFVSHNMVKAPLLRFETFEDSQRFQAWLRDNLDTIGEVMKTKPDGTKSNYTKLDKIDFIHGPGTDLILRISVETGSAVGQNMATFAVEALLLFIQEKAPVKPVEIQLGCGMSGEKKPTNINLMHGRGCKVRARVTLHDKILKRFLRTSAWEFKRYADDSLNGVPISGSLDTSIHQSNALAARFLAHGQDEASVHEASNTAIKYLLSEDGKSIDVSILAPNIAVGTIGGFTNKGISLDTLKIIGCPDPKDPNAKIRLAQIDVATILALEISIIGALSSREFHEAHHKFGR